MTGLARGLGRRAGFVVVAAVAVGALAAAGVDGASRAHAAPAETKTQAQRSMTPTADEANAPARGIPIIRLPLAGKIVGIDPGHNGKNGTDPAFIDRQVSNGASYEDCDTTGTATNGAHPFTEAQFNFDVAGYLRADLIRDGARVVMTRTTNDGIGPCVTTRAGIIDNAHANVAVDIHADGAPSQDYGFSIIEPELYVPLVPGAPVVNRKVIASSARLGADVKAAMLADTRMGISNYYGVDGVIQRDDLAGLNLTTVPKILIEVGNMKNAHDAALQSSAAFQQSVARALLAAIIKFLQ